MIFPFFTDDFPPQAKEQKGVKNNWDQHAATRYIIAAIQITLSENVSYLYLLPFASSH